MATKRRKRRAFGWVGQIKTRGRTALGYYVRFRGADGRVVQRKGGDSRKEAEAFLAKMQGELGREGLRDVDLLTFAREEHLPVVESRVTRRHLLNVVGHLERAGGHFGDMSLRRIGLPELQDYFAALRTSGLSPSTLRRHRASLAVLWKAAVDRNAAAANLPSKLTLPRVQEHAIQYLNADQVRRVCAACPPKVRPLMTFLAESGARLTEGQQLEWTDVADDYSRVTIRQTKSGRVREVPMTPTASEMLARLHKKRGAVPLDGADLVFERTSRNYAYRLFKQAADRVGVPAARVHDLRHAYASQLVQAGVPISVVAQLLGHSTMQVTMRYASHVPASAAVQAVGLLAQARGQTAPRGRAVSA